MRWAMGNDDHHSFIGPIIIAIMRFLSSRQKALGKRFRFILLVHFPSDSFLLNYGGSMRTDIMQSDIK